MKSTFNLWLAKSLTKRIEKYEHHVKKVNQFIKRDRLALKSTMKKFTKEENLRYGRDMGYISQEEYAEMKKDVNARSL